MFARAGSALLALLAVLLAQSPARAAWHCAETKHFIVFSESDAPALLEAVIRLERLDALQRLMMGVKPDSTALKVRVYLVKDNEVVQATMPFGGPGGREFDVAGYYDASIYGPFAVNSREDKVKQGFSAQLVLFHELTHHFMYQYFPAAYPLWYSEGFADLIGSTTFDDTGKARVGAPVGNRYYSLRGMRLYDWIAMKTLLSAKSLDDVKGRADLLYAEGWLLTHYLTITGKRQGQLARYVAAINAGTPFAKAATDAFGDLHKLDDELKAYARLNALDMKVVPLPDVTMDGFRVVPVSAAESALMLYDIRLNAGVPQNDIVSFAASLRKVAQTYPDDPFALRLRAEADRLAGDHSDHAATVAQWLKIAPQDPLALLHAALLEQDNLVSSHSRDGTAWDKVRDQIVMASRLGRGNPEIFKAYHDTFLAQGIEPSVAATNALYHALDLLPQNDEVRYELARDYERRGMKKDAIATIAPAAYADDELLKHEGERRAQLRERKFLALAGQPVHETPREMLERLAPSTVSTPAANGQ
jgi:Flp pilus assembly protein TadD